MSSKRKYTGDQKDHPNKLTRYLISSSEKQKTEAEVEKTKSTKKYTNLTDKEELPLKQSENDVLMNEGKFCS